MMRRLPAAGLPLPPPPPNPPAVESDSPKSGELRLPTASPSFLLFKGFWNCTEKVRLYRLPSDEESPPRPPPPPRPKPPPPPPRRPPPPPPAPPRPLPLPSCPEAFAALLLRLPPKPNVLLTPRFTLKKDGPLPKLRGMSSCPGAGFGSNAPKRVTTTPGFVRSVANAGRSVKSESPLVSRPVVMLKGRPEVIMTSGLRRTPQAALICPPPMKRWRTSNEARPHSLLRSYWFAGNEPEPSVSLSALPRLYLAKMEKVRLSRLLM